MRASLSPLVLLVALAVASTSRALPPPLPPLCGLVAAPPAQWEHVVWIFFENHSYDEIVGSADAPFMNRALIPRCGLATNYRDLTHPSVPNYIAATSGLPLNALGPLANDCNATGPCHTNAQSIFSLAGAVTLIGVIGRAGARGGVGSAMRAIIAHLAHPSVSGDGPAVSRVRRAR